MNKIIIIVLGMCLAVVSNAQEEIEKILAPETSGLIIGSTLGLYISNNTTADYYNGSGTENSINRVVFQTVYNYNRIKDQLLYDFTMGEYPVAMKYNPAAYISGIIGYRTNNGLAPYLEVGITNFKLKDSFTLILNNPGNTTSEPDISVASITGSEKRMDINIGSFYYITDNRFNYYVEAGFNINYVKMISNDIDIEGLKYSIMKTTNPPTLQGGFGYGGFLGGGIKYRFNTNSAAMLGIKADYKSIKLVPDGDKAKYTIHFIPYLKFIFG